jgi:hypothetical protein
VIIIDTENDTSLPHLIYEYNTNLSSMNESLYDYSLYNISIDTIKKWLKHPMLFNKQLRDLSKQLYSSNGIYTNTIDYYVSMPMLNKIVYGENKKHTRYKVNKDKFNKVLEQIKDKEIVRSILHKGAVEGIYFGYFEYSEIKPFNEDFLSDFDVQNISTSLNELNSEYGVNCSIIQLPTDYCKIIGFKNSNYQIAFNMEYFDQFLSNGLSIKLKKYPKDIRDKWKIYKKDINKKWAVLDSNKTVVCKFRADRNEPWGRPFGLAGFVDIMFESYFTDTKRNVLDEVNGSILYQTFPEGEKKGQSSLTQTQQEQQHNNIRNAIFNRKRTGVNFFSIASGTKIDKIKVDTDILKTQAEDQIIDKIATNLGFASSALNGNGSGSYSSAQTNMELVSREILTWIEQIQNELNKVINSNIIKDEKVPIKLYYLPITIGNKDKMVGYAKDLYSLGKGSLKIWIATCEFDADAYLSVLDEELEEDLENKYPIHKISFTQSNDKSGAPEKDSNNDNTLKSKANNTNNTPKPSV